MGLRDRLPGRRAHPPAEAPPAEPVTGGEPELDRAAMKAHMDAMVARGSMSEREYRQEWRRLFGEDEPG